MQAQLGRGGMGVVYRAYQKSLSRSVALKLVEVSGSMDKRLIQRFQIEAQAAAQLNHPCVVPIHSVGRHGDICYYAMKLIEGKDLALCIREAASRLESLRSGSDASAATDKSVSSSRAKVRLTGSSSAKSTELDVYPSREFLESFDRRPVSGAERRIFLPVVRIGIQAAEALHHAHMHTVVHRDIKPSNLMLDDEGRVWVTDFGLAQMQGADGLTMTGEILGTYRYMSPEQTLSQRVPVDGRSDIYSLGVTLYELLTLQKAFPGVHPQEIIRQICFEEPRPPRKLNASIPEELQTIVLKAMSRNPDERYQTAQELADDLQRFLADEPIRARRPSVLQRGRRFLRRYPGAAAATLFMGIIVCVVSTVAAFVIYAKLQREESLNKQLSIERDRAEGRRLFAESRDARDWNPTESLRLAIGGAKLLKEPEAANELMQAADAVHEISRVPIDADSRFSTVHLHPNGHSALLTRVNLPSRDNGPHVAEERSIDDGRLLGQFNEPGALTGAAWSPDGRCLVTQFCSEIATDSATLTEFGIWDAVKQNRLSASFEGGPPAEVLAAGFSPNSRQAALAGRDFRVRLVSLPEGRSDGYLEGHTGPVRMLRYSPDGSRLVTLSADGTVRVWDLETREQLYLISSPTLPEEATAEAEFTDNDHLVVCNSGTVEFLSLMAGKVLTEDRMDGTGIRIHRQPGLIAVRRAGVIRILRLPGLRVQAEIPAERGRPELAFSADARYLVQAGNMGISAWQTDGGSFHCEVRPAAGVPLFAGFSSDGDVVTFTNRSEANTGALLQKWSPLGGSARRSVRYNASSRKSTPVSFSGDSMKATFTQQPQEHTTIFDREGKQSTDPLPGRLPKQPQLPNRTCILQQELLSVWDTSEGRHVGSRTFPAAGRGGTVVSAAAVPRCDWVVLQQEDGPLQFWNFITNELVTPSGLTGEIRRWAIAPGRRLVAVACSIGDCRLIDPETSESVVLPATSSVSSLCFDGNADALAVTNDAGKICVWNLMASPPILLWEQTDSLVAPEKSMFSPNGETLITCSPPSPGLLVARNARTGEILNTVEQPDTRDFCFTPNGSSVALATDSGLVLWDYNRADPPRMVTDTPVIATVLAGRELALIEIAEGWMDTTRSGRPRPLRTNLKLLNTDTISARTFSLAGSAFRLQTDTNGERLLITSRDYGVIVSNLQTLHSESVQADHSAELVWHGFEPHTGRLLTAAEDGRIVAGPFSGSPKQIIDAQPSRFVTAAMSPAGDLFCTGDRSGRIQFWELPEFKPRHVIDGGTALQKLSFSPNARQLLSIDTGGRLLIRDLKAVTGEGAVEILWDVESVSTAVWSPEGDALFLEQRSSTGASDVQIVEPGQSLRIRCRLDIGKEKVHHAGFSRNGHQVAVVDMSGTLRVYRTDTGTPVDVPPTPGKVVTACHTRWSDKLVIVCQNRLIVRDAVTHQDLHVYDGLNANLAGIQSLIDAGSHLLSPDDSLIVIPGSSSSVVCWPIDPLTWAEQRLFNLLNRHDRKASRGR
ncbi:MAG: protein kinase domain-containing protein [Planctomycetaceae bacterium]